MRDEIRSTGELVEAVERRVAAGVGWRMALAAHAATMLFDLVLIAGYFDETLSTTMRFVLLAVGVLGILAVEACIVIIWLTARVLNDSVEDAQLTYRTSAKRRAQSATDREVGE